MCFCHYVTSDLLLMVSQLFHVQSGAIREVKWCVMCISSTPRSGCMSHPVSIHRSGVICSQILIFRHSKNWKHQLNCLDRRTHTHKHMYECMDQQQIVSQQRYSSPFTAYLLHRNGRSIASEQLVVHCGLAVTLLLNFLLKSLVVVANMYFFVVVKNRYHRNGNYASVVVFHLCR